MNFSSDDLVDRERDLVRPWPAPAEQSAGVRLPWLTDSLRDDFTKLAFDLSREYATPKLRAEIMIEGGSAASSGVDRIKEKPPLHEKWRLCRFVRRGEYLSSRFICYLRLLVLPVCVLQAPRSPSQAARQYRLDLLRRRRWSQRSILRRRRHCRARRLRLIQLTLPFAL